MAKSSSETPIFGSEICLELRAHDCCYFTVFESITRKSSDEKKKKLRKFYNNSIGKAYSRKLIRFSFLLKIRKFSNDGKKLNLNWIEFVSASFNYELFSIGIFPRRAFCGFISSFMRIFTNLFIQSKQQLR